MIYLLGIFLIKNIWHHFMWVSFVNIRRYNGN